jgi:hypothetical protein
MKKMMRLLLLLALFFSAFFLYSVMKIKGTPSVVFPPAPPTKNMPLYQHIEKLSVKIGSCSVYEYDKLSAAKEYILSSLKGMGYTPILQDFPCLGNGLSRHHDHRYGFLPQPQLSYGGRQD